MMVAPKLPPNHGTVAAVLDCATWLVDASMLHGAPLRLEAGAETARRWQRASPKIGPDLRGPKAERQEARSSRARSPRGSSQGACVLGR